MVLTQPENGMVAWGPHTLICRCEQKQLKSYREVAPYHWQKWGGSKIVQHFNNISFVEEVAQWYSSQLQSGRFGVDPWLLYTTSKGLSLI